MTGTEAIARLRFLDRSNLRELEKLANQIGLESRQASSAVVAAWLSEKPKMVSHAAFMIPGLHELAWSALLEHLDQANPLQRKRLAQTAVEIFLALRHRIVKALDELLTDSSILHKSGAEQTVEKTVPSLRVCDQAYLLIQRLVRMQGIKAEMEVLSDKGFTLTSIPQRDEAIKTWRRSKLRRNLLKTDR